MSKLYIDFIGAIPSGNVKVHGGANYVKSILLSIMDNPVYCENVCVLWPLGYSPWEADEIRIRQSDKLTFMDIAELDENTPIEEGSSIFFPLIRTRRWNIFAQCKQWYQNVKVYATLHDIRLLDMIPDAKDGYYVAREKNRLYSNIQYMIKSFAYKRIQKKYVQYVDKIYTDSNYSLQGLKKITPNANITVHYLTCTVDSIVESERKIKEKFILFVSAGRKEKNFVRALEAFSVYKSKYPDELYMHAVGIDDEVLQSMIQGNHAIDAAIIQKYVVTYSYVEKDMLNTLYSECEYLLYLSRSEGFGLPVLEAAKHGKPSVASNATSIPEVLGNAIEYVNPYRIDSIVQGMCAIKKNYALDTALVQERIKASEIMYQCDMKKLLNDLFDGIIDGE